MTSSEAFAEKFQSSLDKGLTVRCRNAFLIIAAFIAVFGGWSTLVPLSTAVVASGALVVDGNVKKIQHPYGGVVATLKVSNGDTVEAGDIVMQLDPTQSRGMVEILSRQRVELMARSARLAAEAASLRTISFPENLSLLPAAEEVMRSEAALFDARLVARASQRAQLVERIAQLEIEIESLEAQARSRKSEHAMMQEEAVRISRLYARRLVPETRMLAVKRDLIRLASEREALLAQATRARGNISELRVQILSLDQTAIAEASSELREVEPRLIEVEERLAVAEDQLRRSDIRAPVSGVVHELKVHTVGGVISAGDALMLVVPEGTPLQVEARVSPADIDKLRAGQKAYLRFTAFNQRTTPQIEGHLDRVSPDISLDQATGLSFYVARIGFDAADSASSSLRLVAGMPVEAHISAGTRTALSYLLKPLTDSINRSFKEH